MKGLLLLGVWLVVMAVSTAASAQTDEAPVRHRRVIINFDDDVIEGTGDSPLLEFQTVRRPTRFPSTIKVRENFHRAVLFSAADL